MADRPEVTGGVGTPSQPLPGDPAESVAAATQELAGGIAAEVPPAAAPTADGGTARRVLRPLRHRNFRLWFFGQLTSQIGTWMQMVAQSWLVLKLTDSSMALGVVSFANTIPILLIALVAGVYIDQVNRRRLLVGTQSVMMITAFVLAGITWARLVTLRDIVVLTAVNGMVGAFDRPGRQAFVIEMVGGREDLPGAIALNSITFNGARALGPALAGLALMVISEAGCFFINGISFLAVIWSLMLMDIPVSPRGRSQASMARRLKEGLGYAWHHRAIFTFLAVSAVVNGFGVTYTVLVPVFARNILHGNARTYGLLMAFQGAGAVIGALILSSRANGTRQIRQCQVGGLICMAVAIVFFGLSHWKAASFAAQMLVGLGMMNFNAANNTLIQLFVADELRGRVMSLYTLAVIGLAPLGSLEVGFIGQRVSPQTAVVAAGSIAALCAVYLLSQFNITSETAVSAPLPAA